MINVFTPPVLILFLKDFSHFSQRMNVIRMIPIIRTQPVLPYATLAEGASTVSALSYLEGRNFNNNI